MPRRWNSGGRAGSCALILGALILLFALTAGVPSARAHFLLNLNVRILQVEHLDDGLRVYLRLPLPYVVANLVGPPREDGTAEPAPYTFSRLEDGELMHYFDPGLFEQDPLGLGRLVAHGHSLVIDGWEVAPEVEAVRVYTGSAQPPFATIGDAKRAFENAFDPGGMAPTYAGDVVVDTVIRYRSGGVVYDYSLASTLNPGLPGQDQTANVLIDYFPGEDPIVFRASGLMVQPIEVSRSVFSAALTFIASGVSHILGGYDHVLFVLCLTIGATRLSDLLWRITGFTVGHTVTLILGFWGLAPAGAWFVPAVEAGIALSIIYAGVTSLYSRPLGATFVVAALIGLLHGLGFSFVLREVLQVDSPNIWQSLLSFNLGVELGQIGIVLAIYPALQLVSRWNARYGVLLRRSLVLPAIAIAGWWTVERVTMLVGTL